jgi:hypothetical protein
MDQWKGGGLRKGTYLKNYDVEDPRSSWEISYRRKTCRKTELTDGFTSN